MEQCIFCKIELFEKNFYIYSTSRSKGKNVYMCKSCSDQTYGDKWYPIVGYDEKCEISNRGCVRELREEKYFNMTHVQNAGTRYVFLTKNGKIMRKNILPLMRKFCTES